MTRADIKAELRRSACEDELPFHGVSEAAWEEACEWKSDKMHQHMSDMECDLRTFFLLVAEAM